MWVGARVVNPDVPQMVGAGDPEGAHVVHFGDEFVVVVFVAGARVGAGWWLGREGGVALMLVMGVWVVGATAGHCVLRSVIEASRPEERLRGLGDRL